MARARDRQREKQNKEQQKQSQAKEVGEREREREGGREAGREGGRTEVRRTEGGMQRDGGEGGSGKRCGRHGSPGSLSCRDMRFKGGAVDGYRKQIKY